MNYLMHRPGIAVAVGLICLAAVLPTSAGEVVYLYDDLDRLTSAIYDGTLQFRYRYDDGGNILMAWTGPVTAVGDEVPDVRFLRVALPSPNPFNARVAITLEIKARQNVKVTIYDVRGRRIRELIDEEVDPGTAKIFWDGRDDRGAGVASGLYFGRVSTEHKTVNVRMMFIK